MAEKMLKPSAGAEGGNPRALGASSPEAKRKSTSDAKLIKKLFQLEPLDWARYPNGTLVFIAPDGSKFRYTNQQLDELSEVPAEPEKENSELTPAGTAPASQVQDGPPPTTAANAAAPTGSVSYPQGQE
jgi:hypothetical protein